MSHKAYAIRDAKGDVFGPLMLFLTHGEAERNFSEIIRNPESTIHKYPEDFDLYHIGDYNNRTGKIEPNDTPQHIQKATIVKTALAAQ